MKNFYINHLAVFACALMSLVIGALWYSPLLFFNAWKKETDLSDERLAGANPVKTYSITLILAWIMSYNLAAFLGDESTTWKWGLTAGLLAGIWAIGMFIIVNLFEMRTWKYLLINCGYIMFYFAVTGFILGIWR